MLSGLRRRLPPPEATHGGRSDVGLSRRSSPGTGKIIDLGPAMPYVLGYEQPKATGSSPADRRWGHLVLPVEWVWQGWDKEDSCRHLQRQQEQECVVEKENSRKWAVTRELAPTRPRIRAGPTLANWDGVTSACSWLEFLLALGFLSTGRGSWPESFKPGEQWPSHHPCSPSRAGCCPSAPDRRWM
ncbi:uncharacterized protein LOC113980932 isoform X2 [Neopelma chrysocephalum]|uniref:uncharacterized protein LOC113980932 isoform X2 n=1 Tax=Neopelma chrysocephalum TaxID=114329 RepID=UPI000FCCF608|nr:uncharacterized protein LOC113980932 isoform X2 [Neopelma chrysocephalum]